MGSSMKVLQGAYKKKRKILQFAHRDENLLIFLQLGCRSRSCKKQWTYLLVRTVPPFDSLVVGQHGISHCDALQPILFWSAICAIKEFSIALVEINRSQNVNN